MNENYFDKLSRISASTHNRLLRSDHDGLHKTTYVLMVGNRCDGSDMLNVRCDTLSQMEVINPANPPCFFCEPKGKIRGQLHVMYGKETS